MRHVHAVAVLAVLGCSACAPGVVWVGASPDHAHRVEVLHLRADQWVRIDGHDGPRYDGIGAGSVTFSHDGAYAAYAARRGHAWHVIVSGTPQVLVSDALDGVGELAWSPDGTRLVAQVERAGRWHVADYAVTADAKHLVVRLGPALEAVFADTLRFDAAGDGQAYVAERDGCVVVMRDDVAGPCVDAVGRIVFDSELAYAARRGEIALVVQGETIVFTGAPGEVVSALALGPRGRPLVFVASTEGHARVVRDGTDVGPADAEVIEGLTLSPDGQHLAWVATREGRAHRVVDGREGPPHDVVDAPVFGPDGVLGHIESDAGETRVVIDDVVRGTYSDAGELVLGAGRQAWVAHIDGVSHVVVDGVASAWPGLVGGTLMFSRDGARWGCLAITGADRERDLAMVIDGRVTRPFDFEALAARAQSRIRQQRPAELDVFIRQWAAAELERAGERVGGDTR